MSLIDLDFDDLENLIERSTAFMFGVEDFTDGCCAVDYDPWHHAKVLNIPVVYRDDLPVEESPACFSLDHNAIFIRPSLHNAVERCALAHEIVHYEHNDVGFSEVQENRADRIAARRLIRPSRLEELSIESSDPAVWALELGVTEEMMRIYMRMIRQGSIRMYG